MVKLPCIKIVPIYSTTSKYDKVCFPSFFSVQYTSVNIFDLVYYSFILYFPYERGWIFFLCLKAICVFCYVSFAHFSLDSIYVLFIYRSFHRLEINSFSGMWIANTSFQFIFLMTCIVVSSLNVKKCSHISFLPLMTPGFGFIF